MTTELKSGVKLQGIQPEMLVALMIAQEVYRGIGATCVVTSCRDGTHGRGSLHGKGYAIDLRTRHIDVTLQKIAAEEIGTRLGAEFDVVLEKDHIHVEFDPE